MQDTFAGYKSKVFFTNGLFFIYLIYNRIIFVKLQKDRSGSLKNILFQAALIEMLRQNMSAYFNFDQIIGTNIR